MNAIQTTVNNQKLLIDLDRASECGAVTPIDSLILGKHLKPGMIVKFYYLDSGGESESVYLVTCREKHRIVATDIIEDRQTFFHEDEDSVAFKMLDAQTGAWISKRI